MAAVVSDTKLKQQLG